MEAQGKGEWRPRERVNGGRGKRNGGEGEKLTDQKPRENVK